MWPRFSLIKDDFTLDKTLLDTVEVNRLPTGHSMNEVKPSNQFTALQHSLESLLPQTQMTEYPNLNNEEGTITILEGFCCDNLPNNKVALLIKENLELSGIPEANVATFCINRGKPSPQQLPVAKIKLDCHELPKVLLMKWTAF